NEEETTEEEAGESLSSASGNVESREAEGESASETVGNTPITLTIGDTVLGAYLNDSAPARSLLAQLPLTVTLNDSDNDFCGDSIEIDYTDADVTSGYRNGDLDLWTPANNFVIFIHGEETSASTGDLVNLGRVTSPQEMLDALEGRIEVRIELANAAEEGTEREQSAESAAEEGANAVAAQEAAEAEAAGTAQNTDTEDTAATEAAAAAQSGEAASMRIRIMVGETELTATLEDNATTRAWMAEMPVTLSMSDLYGREMCYRYGAGAFPAEELRSDGYEVGDIAYWPPMGSLVLLYEQNGERFERQHIGHIDSGIEIFETTGDADVTFEVIE
ncbi:MAG: cyclophilin-like fold protein, partial [Eubacteriales bacterium]|nr:cyclophilin-like fold protein [Eubacteriales bacterium]